MRILVDSHIYVWALLSDPRLSTRARTVLRSDDHELFFSLASIWELSIKIRLGKLRLLSSSVAYLHDSLAEHSIAVLPIRYEDILALEQLPPIHRDPFDRILIAQSLTHRLKLLTDDRDVKSYPGAQAIW